MAMAVKTRRRSGILMARNRSAPPGIQRVLSLQAPATLYLNTKTFLGSSLPIPLGAPLSLRLWRQQNAFLALRRRSWRPRVRQRLLRWLVFVWVVFVPSARLAGGRQAWNSHLLAAPLLWAQVVRKSSSCCG